MYKPMTVSPSNLAATERCPGFRPDGEDTQAGIDGTMFHDIMEELVQQPYDQWENYAATRQGASPQLLGLVETAVSELKAIVTEPMDVHSDFRLKMRHDKDGNDLPRKSPLKAGLYPELQLDRGGGRHGYIDLLVVLPEGLCYVVDYKSNRVGKDFSWQLGAYACDVNRLCPAHRDFVCAIIAPRLDDDEQVRMTVGEKEIATLRERIARIEQRADDFGTSDEIVGCPGDQCEHCHRKGKCKYMALAVCSVSETVSGDFRKESEKTHKVTVISSPRSLTAPGGAYEGEVITGETFSNPPTVRQRGLRRACLKYLETMIEAAKKDDSSWASQWTDEQLKDMVPGFSVSRRNGRGSFDESCVPALRRKLMSEFGMTVEDVFECSVPDKALLKEHLATVNGWTKKKAEDEVKRAYEPYTTAGAPTLFWVQKATSKTAAIDAELR